MKSPKDTLFQLIEIIPDGDKGNAVGLLKGHGGLHTHTALRNGGKLIHHKHSFICIVDRSCNMLWRGLNALDLHLLIADDLFFHDFRVLGVTVLQTPGTSYSLTGMIRMATPGCRTARPTM